MFVRGHSISRGAADRINLGQDPEGQDPEVRKATLFHRIRDADDGVVVFTQY